MHTTSRSLSDGWSFRELKPTPIPFTNVDTWLPAEVPGHVHLDLMRLGRIPDPFERMMVRKAQYMYGWDWGPCLRGCGIWQDVALLRVPALRIRDWAYTASFTDDGACQVAVRIEVDGVATGVAVRLSRGGQQVASRADVGGDLSS